MEAELPMPRVSVSEFQRLRTISEYVPRQFFTADEAPIAMPDVRVRFINSSGSDPTVSLVVEISDDLGIRDIQQAWHKLIEWRDRVWMFNGPWFDTPDDRFYYNLFLRREGGEGPTSLAAMLNEQIAENLQEYVRYEKELDQARAAFQTELDKAIWISKYDSGSLWRADDILRKCIPSMTKDERQTILVQALLNIRAKLPPFDTPGNPVVAEDIKARLRYWSKKNKKWLPDTTTESIDSD